MAILLSASFDEREGAAWRAALEQALPGERGVFDRGRWRTWSTDRAGTERG